MAINIDTTNSTYQQYLTGLDNLRTLMLPRMQAFAKLGEAKQRWWLERDPLMRKLIKMSLVINKHITCDSWIREVEND